MSPTARGELLGSPWHPRRRSGLLAGWYLARLEKRRAWLARAGLQPEAFLRILELKLENDARGIKGQSETTMTLGLAILFALSWLAGLGPAGLGLLITPPPLWWMASVSAALSFLLMLVLLGMYDTLLVDGTDIATIAALPVSDRTLFAARLAHLSFYVVLMSGLICFWPMLLGPFRYAWWAVLVCVPLTAALTASFCVGSVALFYAAILRLLGPSRFQRASLYGQVLAMVLLICGPQVLPRLLSFQPLLDAIKAEPRWTLLLPPAWFGGLFELVQGRADARTLALAALALGVPLLLVTLALQLASRHFVTALASGVQGGDASDARWHARWSAPLARLLCRNRAERAGWELALPLVRRDRLFARGAWPSFVGSSLLGIVMFLPMRGRHAELPAGFSVLGLYMCALAFSSVLLLLRFSEHAKARWIFAIAPVEDGAALARGAAKALVCCVLLPVQAGVALLALSLTGFDRAPDAALVVGSSFCVALFAIPHLVRDLPFSHDQTPGRTNTEAIVPALVYSLAVGFAAGVQALASLHWIGQVLLGLLVLVLVPLGWRRLARVELAPLPPI